MNDTSGPSENTILERGRSSAGEKERRGRAGIRDEVAEHVRLRTKSQAADPLNGVNPSEEPARLTTPQVGQEIPGLTLTFIDSGLGGQ